MKEIIISIVIIVALCLCVGNISISLTPFSFKLQRPIMSIGLFLFLLGFSLLMYGKYIDGKKDGYKEAIKDIQEQIAAREGGK